MSEKNDGGPAYPSRFIDHYESGVIVDNGDGSGYSSDSAVPVYSHHHGMSLRDWFAGMALAIGEGIWPGGVMPYNAEEIAENCYSIADAMLKEREK